MTYCAQPLATTTGTTDGHLAREFAAAQPGLALGPGVAASGPYATALQGAVNLLNYLDRFVVTEEMLAVSAPCATFWVADRQSGPALLRYGTEKQREFFLPRIARGE